MRGSFSANQVRLYDMEATYGNGASIAIMLK